MDNQQDNGGQWLTPGENSAATASTAGEGTATPSTATEASTPQESTPAGQNSGPGNVREGMTIPAAYPENDPDYIKLSDGRTAHVGLGKGKHLMEAQERADGKGAMLTAILISLTVTIDGRPIVVEDYQNMPLPDAYKIMGRFNEKNVF